MHEIKDSTMIKGVDLVDGTLRIHFSNGNIYDYEGAGQAQMDGILESASAGRYFGQNIRSSYNAKRNLDAEFDAIDSAPDEERGQ